MATNVSSLESTARCRNSHPIQAHPRLRKHSLVFRDDQIGEHSHELETNFSHTNGCAKLCALNRLQFGWDISVLAPGLKPMAFLPLEQQPSLFLSAIGAQK